MGRASAEPPPTTGLDVDIDEECAPSGAGLWYRAKSCCHSLPQVVSDVTASIGIGPEETALRRFDLFRMGGPTTADRRQDAA
jgi:hypothetical protein